MLYLNELYCLQFEVPALFIQWEATLTNTEKPEIKAAVQEVINIWYTNNPCGRVILIAEEYYSSGNNTDKSIDPNYNVIIIIILIIIMITTTTTTTNSHKI